MVFEALIGGKNVTKKEENMSVNPEHWDKCIFRSNIEKFFVNKCCGGGQCEVEGYVCTRLSINGIIPLHCERCSYFKAKE